LNTQYSHLTYHQVRPINKPTSDISNNHYDVVVIGAGIQGVGIAQAASVCGYKTLVIEKYPLAGMGTSCKSSKLIHGGLRYLESGQLRLVKECLQERNRLLKNAPELVKLIPFYIPVYSNSSRSSWRIWLGLCIYTLFSLKPFEIVKKSQWSSLDHLKKKNLIRVFKYYDAQTDDQLLTQSVAKSAQRYGAEFIYDADFTSSKPQQGSHIINYNKDKTEHAISSKYLINCSGPWVKETQKKIQPKLNIPRIELISGSHIIVDIKTTQGAYYLETRDKRAVFIIPWKEEYTLIGTTETVHTDTTDNISATKKDINYLIDAYNKNFDIKISKKNIIDTFCGLRVLPKDSSSIFNKSRDSLIVENKLCPGLITLIGGKLTAYRASAELVISKINIKKTRPKANTRKIKLSTG
jgi:glycerol-3-phosphate dehydrogenase